MARGFQFDTYDQAKIDAMREAQKPAAKASPKHQPHDFRCDECGRPGMFGEGVHLLKGIEGSWYCSKHAPDHLKHPGAAR